MKIRGASVTPLNEIKPSQGYIKDMEEKIRLTWENNTLIWGDKDGFVWDQVYIVKKAEKILNDGGMGGLPQDALDELHRKMTEPEVKKFIRVVCEVNGKIYSESRYKTVEKHITIEDIQRTFDRFVNVRVEDI